MSLSSLLVGVVYIIGSMIHYKQGYRKGLSEKVDEILERIED